MRVNPARANACLARVAFPARMSAVSPLPNREVSDTSPCVTPGSQYPGSNLAIAQSAIVAVTASFASG